jgi:cytochrome c oxidase cbb3-type subunit 3
MELEGGIGFDLADAEWVHGSEPVDVYRTIDEGIEGSGMQAWGPTLGPKKVAEVTAYVLSHHTEETIGGVGDGS